MEPEVAAKRRRCLPAPGDTVGSESSSDIAVQRFVLWLERNGASANGVCIRSCSDGLGLFARRPFQLGEEVCRVPQSLALTPQLAVGSTVGRAAVAAGASPQLALWMYMAVCCDDKEHVWHPYFSLLPRQQPDPTGWSEELLRRELCGTGLPVLVREAKHEVEAEFGCVHPRLPAPLRDLVNFERVLWARGVFLSRCFPAVLSEEADVTIRPDALDGTAGVSTGKGLGCLVPLLDLMNHKAGHPAQWESRGGAILVRALVEINTGDEIHTNYGDDRSNEDLFFLHGFAVPNNPYDVATGLVLSCDMDNSELAEGLRAALTAEGLPCAQGGSAGRSVLVGPFIVGGPSWQAPLPPRLWASLDLLSPDQMLKSLRAFRISLAWRQELLDASYAADATTLEGWAGASGLARSLAAYRDGQRRALDATLAEVEEALQG